MNHPLSYGPYKVYQSNYQPLTDPETLQLIVEDDGHLVSMSGLSVAHDPGLWCKYIGSTLLVLGIATMFYMRAYFFKARHGRRAATVNRPSRTRGARTRCWVTAAAEQVEHGCVFFTEDFRHDDADFTHAAAITTTPAVRRGWTDLAAASGGNVRCGTVAAVTARYGC